MISDFDNNKKTFLSKQDKSKKGGIDKAILPLVEKINQHNDYYTTSSCSGRIVLLKESESGRKDEAEWLFVSHDKIKVSELKIEEKEKVWFKFEPAILHINCRNIEAAQFLLDKARPLFKITGIMNTSKLTVEIRGTDRIDAPVLEATDEYISILVNEANTKLEKTRQKLNDLEMLF